MSRSLEDRNEGEVSTRPWGRVVFWVLLSALGLASPGGAQVLTEPVQPAASRAVSEADVIRFLEQATFGPAASEVSRVKEAGFAAWLDQQFDSRVSSYPVPALFPADQNAGCPSGSDANCLRDHYTMYPLQVAFFLNGLRGEDQLRQRVALALHEIFVVSGVKLRQPAIMAPYQNLLLDQAFGNYRTLLENITLNPSMGAYLDMVNNDAPIPP
ncbi:MAG: DUF1800 family protein, partial [Acidobacteria bacterium]|nr:DUF1800 family protein [Acidobacteriota bacterium]